MNQPSVVLLLTLGTALSAAQQQNAARLSSGDLERGKYLTHHVAMCIQCHTPRGADGSLLLERAFEGAPIPVAKPAQWTAWAEFAPRIAGLPQYNDDQFITLMTIGIGREGKPLRAPMPTFRLTREDAEAVAAYLRSLR
ncbi:MAG: hypothetical protein C4326_14705 [Ignavibacteria bacterium]